MTACSADYHVMPSIGKNLSFLFTQLKVQDAAAVPCSCSLNVLQHPDQRCHHVSWIASHQCALVFHHVVIVRVQVSAPRPAGRLQRGSVQGGHSRGQRQGGQQILRVGGRRHPRTDRPPCGRQRRRSAAAAGMGPPRLPAGVCCLIRHTPGSCQHINTSLDCPNAIVPKFLPHAANCKCCTSLLPYVAALHLMSTLILLGDTLLRIVTTVHICGAARRLLCEWRLPNWPQACAAKDEIAPSCAAEDEFASRCAEKPQPRSLLSSC